MDNVLVKHIHFVGISGAGLSALAQVMLGRGNVVSGSDSAAPNAVTDALETLGAKIYAGHAAENITGADLVVITSAAQQDNAEIVAAHLQQIPIVKRRNFLRTVTQDNDVIAVAGSHGKTTTTAMISLILTDAGQDPTAVVGGIVPGWNTNARVGKSNWFVIEADEYDYAFMGLEPKIAVVTNIDYDHPDLFPTRETYQNAFFDFLKQTRTDGLIIVCGDEQVATEVASKTNARLVRYGLNATNDWRAVSIKVNGIGGSDFEIARQGQIVGYASLQLPGTHHILDALAAVAAASEAGVSVARAVETLGKFTGVGRRFQVRGTFNGATIVDDYAHHPTEIKASLRGARQRFPNARIFALFQPHTFSRTQALLDEFANAFGDADVVLITEIYASRERNENRLSGQAIVAQIELAPRMEQSNVRFIETLDAAEQLLRSELRAGDVLVTLGAGNVNVVAIRLVENGNA